MAAPNAQPRFTKNGKVQSVLVTAANTSSQGGGTVGTDIFKCFDGDATNGSFIEKLRVIATATTPTATTATVLRVFISSVNTGTTTSSNTFLIGEFALASVSADNASTGLNAFDVPLGFTVPAGYSILVTNHAAPAANTAWRVTAIGGDY